MSWEIEPMEIIKDGVETGRYRLVAESDEGDILPLCNCKNGHDSEEEAIECPEAMDNAGAYE